MHSIYNDLLPELQHMKIKQTVESENFLWTYTPGTTPDVKMPDVPQFVRVIEHSDIEHETHYTAGKQWTNWITEALFARNPKEIKRIVRSKMNLLMPHPAQIPFHAPHTDVSISPEIDIDKYMSILYYVNNSDGATHLFHPSGEPSMIEPKANRCLVIPAALTHASSSPVSTDRRIVMNIVVELR